MKINSTRFSLNRCTTQAFDYRGDKFVIQPHVRTPPHSSQNIKKNTTHTHTHTEICMYVAYFDSLLRAFSELRPTPRCMHRWVSCSRPKLPATQGNLSTNKAHPKPPTWRGRGWGGIRGRSCQGKKKVDCPGDRLRGNTISFPPFPSSRTDPKHIRSTWKPPRSFSRCSLPLFFSFSCPLLL